MRKSTPRALTCTFVLLLLSLASAQCRGGTTGVDTGDGDPGSAESELREGILERAREWLLYRDGGTRSLRVNYSKEVGSGLGGYRADCSGFVSYAWGVWDEDNDGGYSTQGLMDHFGPSIAISGLQPGDILVADNETTQHALIFVRWLASEEPQDLKFLAYEMNWFYGYALSRELSLEGCRNEACEIPEQEDADGGGRGPYLVFRHPDLLASDATNQAGHGSTPEVGSDPDDAGSVAGIWKGTAFQRPGGTHPEFILQMNLSQTKSAVEGTSRIQVVGSAQYHGLMSITGTTDGERFHFQEGALIENYPEPDTFWCIKQGTLHLSAANGETVLEGEWEAPGCSPGSIVLRKQVPRTIGVQAGHGNGDPGAQFCEGAATPQNMSNEAELNHAIAAKVVDLLNGVAGYNAYLFVGEDAKMAGFIGDAFVALHADQGRPGVSGYKVSRYGGARGSGLNGSGDPSDELVQSLWDQYGHATGLSQDTAAGHFTRNMLNYYALGWIDPDTPGAIIEMGWLCDDLDTLLCHQAAVADGIARGIIAFLGDSTAELPVPVESEEVASEALPGWMVQLAGNPITPNVGMAGVSVGDSERQVIAALGEPDELVPVMIGEDQVSYYALMYRHGGLLLGIYTRPDDRRIWAMRVYDDQFNQSGRVPSVRGVSIGGTLDQLLDRFGDPKDISSNQGCPPLDEDGGTRATAYSYDGIEFWVCSTSDEIYLIDIPS